MHAFCKRLPICMCASFPFGFEGEMWDLILSIPDCRVSFYVTANILTPNPSHKLSPSNFIAGRPKVALLFGFFGDFRCGVLLFMVILVIYKYKNRKKKTVVKCKTTR